ncbi:Na+/H+ antiporter subunit E [Halarchaeum grantii]|uniref:Na+/H+ antiporter subunit E n=1 Tax=Halarchaeum grantii TaxID=1193105 RepID=A0A830F9I2_9EURY|nr:Na+/H+ antiporter subunit E [Halarchaeum grantii]GGL32831.1 Na+/H+ antiporter subunit E [Halarchaeum grantii]
MRDVPRWVTAGFALAVVWIFVAETPGTPRAVAANLVIGLALSLPVAYVFRALFPGRSDLSRTTAVVPAVARYVGTFVYELLTANVEVAKRVLAPSMPLDPGVVVIPLRVESDAAVTVIANSITLTPGTLTMDYDGDANALHVHAVDAADLDGLVEPVRRWERYALVIFDEDADPDAPAPAPSRLEVSDDE